MKKLFLSTALFLFLVSCHSNSGTDHANADSINTSKNNEASGAKPNSSRDTVIHCFGTNPFWFVDVMRGGEIVYRQADAEEVHVDYVDPVTIDSITEKYTSTTGPNTIELTIKKQSCTNEMGNNAHPFSVDLLLNKKHFSGCGKK